MKVILISPGGATMGGGMGTVTKNLKASFEKYPEVNVNVIDSRGENNFFLSLLVFFKGLIYTFNYSLLHRIEKSSKLVYHINVSERFSFVRKAAFVLLAKLFRAKVILHHHGAELIEFYQGTSAVYKAIIKFCITKADINIVLGLKWRTFIEDNFGCAETTKLLYNAVPTPPSSLNDVRRKRKVDKKQFSIAMIGNLTERKGISLLLEFLQNTDDEAVHINFIGGGDVAKYIKKAEALGVSKQCDFLGWQKREDAIKLLVRSDALILPSYDEGLPMVILEAMAHRIPVITTPVGAIEEVFTNRQQCLFLKVGCSSDIKLKVDLLRGDKGLRERLVSSAYEKYLKDFSQDNYTAKIIQYYSQV